MLPLLVLAAALLPPALAIARPPLPRLQHGQVQRIDIDYGETSWSGRIDLPDGTEGFTVQVAGDADADIYLRPGKPFQLDLTAEAHVAARAEGPSDHVAVRGPLARGTWFVRVEAEEVESASTLELVVLVEDKRDGHALSPGPAHDAKPMLDRDGRVLTTSLFVPSEGVEKASVVLLHPPRDLTGRRYEIRAASGDDTVLAQGDLRSVIPLHGIEGALELRIVGGRADGWRARSQLQLRLSLEDAEDEPRVVTMRVGQTRRLEMGGDETSTRYIRIEGAEGRVGVVIEAETESYGDVDLFARRGKIPSAYEDESGWFSLSTQDTERLVLRGDRPLGPGDVYCLVELVDDADTEEVTLRVREPKPTDAARAWGEGELPVLPPQTWRDGRLVSDDDNGYAWYRVAVPRGTRSLHARVLDADAPVDLVLARLGDGGVVRRNLSPLVDEHLDVSLETPSDADGTWLLGVVSRDPFEAEVAFRVAFAPDEAPAYPAGTRWPRRLTPDPARPHQQVVAATVEVTVRDNSGGSGTCVTPSGHVLTCQHVLELDDTGEVQMDGIIVSFVDRVDRPPVQTYRARVLFEDEELDLALLALTGDVHGTPMPTHPKLPYLPLGDPERLGLGDPVTVYGYPADGSDRARTPIILSRGVIAGLEADREGLAWLKTDAFVGSGHSGGTLVGVDRSLLGVPSATLGKLEVLGLAVPVSRIPAPWRRVIEQALPSAKAGAPAK